MSIIVAVGIFLLSLTSWPTSIILNKLNLLQSQGSVVLSGIVYILIVLLGTFFLFRRYFKKVDPLMYVFSLYCFDATCSLGSALELDGYIKIPSLSNTTVAEPTVVEPYLKTAHGVMISYWNGIVHYILCIAAIYLYTNRDSHREVSLYWSGSLLNSMVVLLPVCIAGKEPIKAPTLFNLLYLVLPVFVIIYYIDRRPVQARTFIKYSSIWKRPVDLIFLVYFLAAIVLAVFRGLAAQDGKASCMTDYVKVYDPYVKDASEFPKFQAVTYEYLFVVYYLVAAFGLISPGQHWMSDWSLIHAGAAAQAQFSYISGSLHHLTPHKLHSPKTGTPAAVFWSVNLALFVVPHLFAWWCQRDPENFGRTYTVELATPVQTYTSSKSSLRLSKKAN